MQTLVYNMTSINLEISNEKPTPHTIITSQRIYLYIGIDENVYWGMFSKETQKIQTDK